MLCQLFRSQQIWFVQPCLRDDLLSPSLADNLSQMQRVAVQSNKFPISFRESQDPSYVRLILQQ